MWPKDGTLVPEDRKLAICWSLIANFPLAGMEGVKPSVFKLLSLCEKNKDRSGLFKVVSQLRKGKKSKITPPKENETQKK